MFDVKSSENAKLQIESGQELNVMAALTDSGDHKIFTSAAYPWSKRSGYEPSIKPDGLETGGVITPGAAVDKVAVAALTCYLAGVKVSVGADSALSVSRPAASPAGYLKVVSITVNSAGALAVVAGTDGETLSATRGAAGGPPLIPVGSIEIGQVTLTSSTSAIVLSSEISQAPGTSQEKYDYPTWSIDYFTGKITFASALPAIHAGSPATYKGVYAQVYEPVFSDFEPVSDFKAPENSHSVTSTQVYGGTIGATSASLGQGGFKIYVKDGVTDAIIGLKGLNLLFKYFPDRNNMPYVLCQGKLGINRSWPAADNNVIDCTISASEEGTNNAS